MSSQDRSGSPADEERDLEPAEIDLSYAPRPRQYAITKHLGDEVVVLDGSTGNIHVLNPSAAVVWECLDGEVSIGELAAELAEAFAVAPEAMQADVLAAARDFGHRSLLDGVSVAPKVHATPGMAPQLQLDELLEPFAVTDSTGARTLLPLPTAERTLLVNWSPACGYCALIVPKLDGLRAALTERGVELVLLTLGSREDNEQLLADTDLAAATYYRLAAGDDEQPRHSNHPFGPMGTPVACLVDPSGRVAELASGAVEVPRLARELAGLPPEDEQDNGLIAASGMCGPGSGSSSGKPARIWARTSAYRIGELEVGVRADSRQTDALLGEILAAYRLPDGVKVPANFSVVLGDTPGDAPGAGSKRANAGALSLLLVGDRTAVRSRSPRRAVEALVAHLSALLDPPEAQLLRTSNLVVVRDGRAVLLPTWAWGYLEKLQSPLARDGIALSDAPEALVDALSGELVVRAGTLAIERPALDQLAPLGSRGSELPAVAAGRYPIEAWLLDEDAPSRTGTPSVAVAAAGVLPAVRTEVERAGEVIDSLELAFKSIRPVVLALTSIEQLVPELDSLFGGA